MCTTIARGGGGWLGMETTACMQSPASQSTPSISMRVHGTAHVRVHTTAQLLSVKSSQAACPSSSLVRMPVCIHRAWPLASCCCAWSLWLRRARSKVSLTCQPTVKRKFCFTLLRLTRVNGLLRSGVKGWSRERAIEGGGCSCHGFGAGLTGGAYGLHMVCCYPRHGSCFLSPFGADAEHLIV